MNRKQTASEISVITRTYDFTLWMLPHIANFSRQHRFTLGNHVEETLLEILEALVEASYSRDKLPLLNRANLRLERLRYLVRLCKDLHLLNLKQYEFAIEAMLAVGNEIGGWTKHQTNQKEVAS